VIYHGLPLDDLPPERRPQRSSFRYGVPPQLQQKVVENWQRYGYGGAEP
jgi:hypothetical protein